MTALLLEPAKLPLCWSAPFHPGESGTKPMWLRLIWAANALAEERGLARPFGTPSSFDTWEPGVTTEEYAQARVIHHNGRKVHVQALAPEVADLLAEAHTALTQEIR